MRTQILSGANSEKDKTSGFPLDKAQSAIELARPGSIKQEIARRNAAIRQQQEEAQRIRKLSAEKPAVLRRAATVANSRLPPPNTLASVSTAAEMEIALKDSIKAQREILDAFTAGLAAIDRERRVELRRRTQQEESWASAKATDATSGPSKEAIEQIKADWQEIDAKQQNKRNFILFKLASNYEMKIKAGKSTLDGLAKSENPLWNDLKELVQKIDDIIQEVNDYNSKYASATSLSDESSSGSEMSLTTRTDTPILSVASLSTEEMQANASDSDDQARQQASEVGNIQVEDTSISVKLFQEPDILQSTAVYHDMQSASDDITDLLDKSIIASKYTDKHPLPSKAEGDTDLQTEPPKLEEGSKSGESCHLHFDDEGHHRTNVTKELPAMSPSDVCIPGGNGIASKTQGQDALQTKEHEAPESAKRISVTSTSSNALLLDEKSAAREMIVSEIISTFENNQLMKASELTLRLYPSKHSTVKKLMGKLKPRRRSAGAYGAHKISKNAVVFGRSLEELMAVDTGSSERTLDGHRIPTFVTKCVECLRRPAYMTHIKEYWPGTHFPGIFRRATNKRTLEELRDKIEAGQDIDYAEFPKNTDTVDAYAIGALLKMFFRELKEPLFTHKLYKVFLSVSGVKDCALRIRMLQLLIHLMPSEHIAMAQYIFAFLAEVASHAEVNLMTPENLATVFGPNLLRRRDSETRAPKKTDMDEYFLMADVIAFMIENHSELWQLPPDVSEKVQNMPPSPVKEKAAKTNVFTKLMQRARRRSA